MPLLSAIFRRSLSGLALILALCFALAACEDKKQPRPDPFTLTEEATGKYCGMNMLEHAGPKGQIILKGYDDPIWFSSVRDAIAFTMLPDEPKDFLAVYVSDMAKTDNWDNPGADNWVEARDAFYVIGSRKRGGMGADEAVPFSAKEAAETFSIRNGGKVVTFTEIPQSYVLGSGDIPEMPEPAEKAGSHGNH